jgi:ribosomal-protein-alanine N-acetyltransferase
MTPILPIVQDMKPVNFLPIQVDGAVDLPTEHLPQAVKDNCAGMAAYYPVIGFHPPWIGYVTVHDGKAVGGGAFKGAPRDGRVEIAYYTAPELEGQGFGTATASALARMARGHDPALIVAAQTLPGPNASCALLEKLGFALHGTVQHPEDGEVWEWRLPR